MGAAEEHSRRAGWCARPDSRAFFGADKAADRLAELPEWQSATIVNAVPDTAQQPVRARAPGEGKLVYRAVPKLAKTKPFYLLDPDTVPVSPAEAADRGAAAKVGQAVDVDSMRPPDLIVCGSVAVNRRGVRLGKGAGTRPRGRVPPGSRTDRTRDDDRDHRTTCGHRR